MLLWGIMFLNDRHSPYYCYYFISLHREAAAGDEASGAATARWSCDPGGGGSVLARCWASFNVLFTRTWGKDQLVLWGRPHENAHVEHRFVRPTTRILKTQSGWRNQKTQPSSFHVDHRWRHRSTPRPLNPRRLITTTTTMADYCLCSCFL